MPTLVIGPTMFMENLLFDREAIEGGELPTPVPAELRMSYIAVRDVGRAFAAALLRPDLAGEEFDMCGPEALDGDERAAALGRALGREVCYRQIPLADVEPRPAVRRHVGRDRRAGRPGRQRRPQMALQPGERLTLEEWAREAFAQPAAGTAAAD